MKCAVQPRAERVGTRAAMSSCVRRRLRTASRPPLFFAARMTSPAQSAHWPRSSIGRARKHAVSAPFPARLAVGSGPMVDGYRSDEPVGASSSLAEATSCLLPTLGGPKSHGSRPFLRFPCVHHLARPLSSQLRGGRPRCTPLVQSRGGSIFAKPSPPEERSSRHSPAVHRTFSRGRLAVPGLALHQRDGP